jgi:hypothetical protein
MKHLVRAQMPFSFEQLKRLDRSIESVDVLTKGKFDEYGQTFEFGDEFQGLFGFREVKVNPARALDFKIANYQRGVRESRQLFTRESLRGGPVEPRDIVDAYINANRALFDVRKNFKGDIDAARILNISDDAFRSSTARLSNVDIATIDNNVFRPIEISPDIRLAFRENADKIGIADPLDAASSVIQDIQSQMRNISLSEVEFPVFENPLLPILEDTLATPQTLNLPSIDSNIINNPGAAGNFSGLTTADKLRILFPQG